MAVVACRLRPFTQQELARGEIRCVTMQGSVLGVADSGTTGGEAPTSTTFDHCFQSHAEEGGEGLGPYATGEAVFAALALPLVQAALSGKESLLIDTPSPSCGSSTHCTLGSPDDPGLLARAAGAALAAGRQTSLSVVEVYQERAYDLLAPAPPADTPRRPVRVAAEDGAVAGLEEREILALADLGVAVELSQRNSEAQARIRAAPEWYTVYMLRVAGEARDGGGATGRLCIVGCPTAEVRRGLGATGEPQQLSVQQANRARAPSAALNKALRALAEGKPVRTYRESQLTLLLRRPFEQGVPAYLLTVSPAGTSSSETLRAARRAAAYRLPPSGGGVTLQVATSTGRTPIEVESASGLSFASLREGVAKALRKPPHAFRVRDLDSGQCVTDLSQGCEAGPPAPGPKGGTLHTPAVAVLPRPLPSVGMHLEWETPKGVVPAAVAGVDGVSLRLQSLLEPPGDTAVLAGGMDDLSLAPVNTHLVRGVPLAGGSGEVLGGSWEEFLTRSRGVAAPIACFLTDDPTRFFSTAGG